LVKGRSSNTFNKKCGNYNQNHRGLPLNDKSNYKKYTCSNYIVVSLKQAGHALTYADFGTTYKYGTMRNTMSKLVDKGRVLKLPKECPARFILPEWAHRPEYSYVQRNDKRGKAVRFDFLSYLERISWSPVLGVHDLRLSFFVYQLHWIRGRGWKYCKRSHSFRRRFNLSYPVDVQCYDTGTVLVSIKCSAKPFTLDVDGLIALSHLLGEVRAYLNAPCVPEPSTWRVAQWHLNRDSEELQGASPDFYMTFKDFFDDTARFYYKNDLERYRAEVIQNPNQSIKEVFENILNRDNAPEKSKRGDFPSG
jgi:hypothetical protein